MRCLTIDESQEGGDSGYTEIVTPGGNVTAGVDQCIYLTEDAYDIVTFDYKFTSGTKMNVALLQADWAKYYGYIKVDANGIVGSYDGVTSEKLSNGYIRVTMELANMTMTNDQNNANNAPKSIALLYVRGDWSDANAVIDNVRCLTRKEGTTEPEAPSNDLSAATKTLYVPQGEEFVILNLSDLQLHDGQDPQYTYDVIRQLVEKTDPDLITVLGDTAQDNRNYPATTNFANLVKYIDSFGIPWAPIFGNHDHDTYSPGYDSPKGVSDEWIMAQFAGAKNCIFMEGPSSVDGCGNYIVHIKEQGTDKLVRALYFFDSLLVGVNETHVQFYRDAVAYTTELNGGETLESIVFLHIPLPEYATVYSQQLAVDFADTVGTVNSSAPGSGTTEFFTAIKELGSTRNVIAGHEHDNAYYMTYEGVKLIYNMKSSDGDNYHNVASTGGGVFTIGKTTEFRYERTSVKQEVTEATSYAMPLLANWQGSGKGISFTFSATDTLKSGDSFSFVLCGSNPRRTSLELKDRHGSWNRLTNSVTVNLTTMTASLGTVTANGDGTYTYSLKLTDAPLNTAASEAAYGDETLKLIYFNSVSHSFKISDLCYVDGTSVPTAPRGEAFVAGEDKDILLDNKEALAQISFEYKLTDGQQFNIGLMPDWSNFFGYFTFNAEGNVYAYDGVTTQKLSDGYIRVTLDMAALTKYSGNPSTAIDFLFIRGAWSDANGYIDNVCFLTESEMEQGGNDSGYTEIVTPGGSFGANEGITINFEPGAYDIVTFDYKITNGGTMDICLMDASWSKYYGYFNFGVAGANYEYDGLSYESLDNGYIRVTLNVSELNKTNLANNRDNAPETVGVLFVRDDWSSAAGSIDNVRLLTKVSGGTEPENPEEPETPVNVNISYEFSGNEANRAGYAEGVVTLSGGDSRELYEMYWCNASGKLTGYKALATLTGANKTLTIGENVMIPAGADRLCAYVGDQLVASYMLDSKAHNAQVKTKFAVLSDVHTNYSSGETYLRTVLKKLQAEGVGYVIITGDIAEGNAEWAKYVSAVEDSGFTGLVLASAGNHDHAAEAKVQFRAHAIYDGAARTWVALSDAPAYFANTYAGSLAVAAEYSDMENKEAMYYLVTIDDNAYIFMNQELSNPNYTNHEDNFSRAQLNFVEDALYRYSKTHNVFIAQHAGIDEFVVNAGDGHSIQTYDTFPYAKRFAELLKAYPEAIWVSGHSHYEFSEAVQFLDRLYVDGVLTDIAFARSFGCSSATVSSDFTSHSEGYVCYQYENDIVFEARRFKESGTDGNNENNFINLAMPANSFIIPVMVGNDHAEPILAENLVTAEGVTANGTYTVKAGNQSAAWNRDAYLRFYVQTELTNLTVGSVNVDLTAQSGSNYSVIRCMDGWKFVQVAFDSLTTMNGSADFAVTITGNGSFQLKEMYIEPIDLNWLRGENATQGQNINFDAEVPATDAVIFDYFALPGSELAIALLDDWSNFYGYFQFNANGAAKNYAGITTEKLSDGYIRVTAILSEITQKAGSPTKVTSLYIGGSRTTGAGMVDNVQFIAGEVTPEAPEPIEYRGQEIVVGQDLSVMTEQAANYSQVILEMIVPAEGGENEIGIALLDTNWNYYGYFYLEKTGLEKAYAGVSAEKLSDGYWRITINIDEIDSSRTHGDVGDIERVYINNHTTGGYIDNVQFIVE